MSVLPALAAALMLQSPAATAEDLGWMAGYWLDCSNGREAAEAWSDPRQGLMVGWALTVRGGRAGFEASHIKADPEGRLGYFAQPDGAPPTLFLLTEQSDGRAVFQNTVADDYPARIIYARDGDRMTARIEGQINGRERSAAWTFERKELNSRCPS